MTRAVDDRIRVVVQEELRRELKPVLERLDRLNGIRNKLLGMAILLAFVSPIAVVVLVKA
jgi:hypothetical protein